MPATIAPPAAPAPAATPTPAPAAAPAPAPAPSASPASGGEDTSDFDAVLAKRDAVFEPAAEAPDKPGEGEPKAPAPAPAKPADKPAEAKPDDKEARTFASKGQLREAYEKSVSELATTRKSVAEHQAKVKLLEGRISDAEAKGKDATVLTERLAKAEKERDEAMANLRAAKQETSPEFKEKYDKPFESAAEDAREEIGQLAIVDADGQPVRKATWEKDFAGVYALDYIDAKARAKELFGEDAPRVMEHYNALHRLDRARAKGLAEERAHWQEKLKADEANQVKHRQAFNAVMERVDADVKKHYDFLKEDPEDPEYAEALQKGYSIVDAKPETFEERALQAATRRHWAAAAMPLANRVKKLAAENATLKATIEELKASGPGPTKRPGGVEESGEKDMMEDLRESLK